jgi:hypothetical protein
MFAASVESSLMGLVRLANILVMTVHYVSDLYD